jgi:hypothetical protein
MKMNLCFKLSMAVTLFMPMTLVYGLAKCLDVTATGAVREPGGQEVDCPFCTQGFTDGDITTTGQALPPGTTATNTGSGVLATLCSYDAGNQPGWWMGAPTWSPNANGNGGTCTLTAGQGELGQNPISVTITNVPNQGNCNWFFKGPQPGLCDACFVVPANGGPSSPLNPEGKPPVTS